MIKKNRIQGFSLIELVIGASLLGGFALGLNAIMRDMTKGNQKGPTDGEILVAFNEMVEILSDSSNCFASLGGKNATNDKTVTKLKYKTADKFAVGAAVGKNNFQLLNYTISGYDVATNSAILSVIFEKKKLIGEKNLVKKINLDVEVDSSNTITACRSLATSSADLGIKGTRAGLDVAGSVRPGNETQVTTCDAKNEGTQRYNKTSHSLEYCGASGSPLVYAWAGLGGGVSCIKFISTTSTLNLTAPILVGYTMTGGGGGGGIGGGVGQGGGSYGGTGGPSAIVKNNSLLNSAAGGGSGGVNQSPTNGQQIAGNFSATRGDIVTIYVGGGGGGGGCFGSGAMGTYCNGGNGAGYNPGNGVMGSQTAGDCSIHNGGSGDGAGGSFGIAGNKGYISNTTPGTIRGGGGGLAGIVILTYLAPSCTL